MSSILEALKKLEEERNRQLKLIEKNSEEPLPETSSEEPNIVEVPTPSRKTQLTKEEEVTSFEPKKKERGSNLTFKQLIVIIAIIGFFLTIISLSFSYIVVHTQLSKVMPSTQSIPLENQPIKNNEAPTNQPIKTNNPSPEDPPFKTHSSTKTESSPNTEPQSIPPHEKSPSPTTKSVPLSTQTIISNQGQTIYPNTSPQEKNDTKDKISNNITSTEEAIPNTTKPTQEQPQGQQKNITNIEEKPSFTPHQQKLSKNISNIGNINPSQETNHRTSGYTSSNPEENNSPQQALSNKSSPDIIKSTQEDPLTSSIQSEKETEEKLITAKNSNTSTSPQITTPKPLIETRELPPPPISPEKFQLVSTYNQPPKPEEPIDITKLPVLKTSDRIRLGLENMQLNVLREPGPKNPHGLAIINLTKVYVGEMIPGTPVKLIDVKAQGIAIEVVGTGERYYVPR